jgi:hypothetical protein
MAENTSTQKSLSKRFRGTIHHALKSISPRLLHAVSKRFSHTCAENWRYRAALICSCPDYALISPAQDAGKILDGCQIMHNGLKVLVGSYYGEEASILFSRTKGVHEPQEERVFGEILKLINPKGVILELGAYWGFYSMWFCGEVPEARAYLVEPLPANLDFGKRNFALNGFKGDFTQAYVGRKAGVSPDGTKVIGVDEFMQEKGLEKLSILHCDIQGFELEMLAGAENAIQGGKIDYYFISTHSAELHAACEAFLKERGKKILASVNLAESYSMDGILVCADPTAPALKPIHLSRKPIGQ